MAILGIWILLITLRTPSHDRDWKMEHILLPYAEISDDSVTIYNVRDFEYYGENNEPIPFYYDTTVNLDQVEGVDFIISYFSEYKGIAHTFLSFRIKDTDPIAISIEARREKGEEYSPLKGLLRNFEEMYVIGDERDLIGLRTHIRKEEVYIFPGNATPEKAKELFVSMIEKATYLKENPKFYNTLTSQCTNELARHVEEVSGKDIPFSYKLLLPGYADEFAYDLGFIGNEEITLEQLKAKHQVNPENTEIEDENFSEKIRN